MNLGHNVAFCQKELYDNPFIKFVLVNSNAIKVDREKLILEQLKML